MAVIDRFDLATGTMKNDGENGFCEQKKSPTTLTPPERSFYGS